MMADLHEERCGHVAVVEVRRGPDNFFDVALVRALADLFVRIDGDPAIRAILLCSEGKNFCAGANFTDPANDARANLDGDHIYNHAVRLFRCAKPVVAAVQGTAAGGGLGLAMVADFRVGSPESRFTANFARLGIHAGFGLSATLPRVLGIQRAARMLFTGERIGGEEGHRIGLLDRCVAKEHLRDDALALATEIAASAPLAVTSMRETLRTGLAELVAAAVERERDEQTRLMATEDFRIGVEAMARRQVPDFRGR